MGAAELARTICQSGNAALVLKYFPLSLLVKNQVVPRVAFLADQQMGAQLGAAERRIFTKHVFETAFSGPLG